MKKTDFLPFCLGCCLTLPAMADNTPEKEQPDAIQTIQQEVDKPEQVSKEYKDLDQDGVPDRFDHCLNTPPGVAVNSFGCELDSDGDGIFDRVDQCPNTPKGVTVNFLGCEPDTDKDLVLDSQDKCPGTPLGTPVNEFGCKIENDDDKDGITNDIDQCPDTPAGATVNRYGCVPQNIVTTRIHFNTGSYEIRADQKPLLQKNISQIRNIEPDEVVLITGYTDSQGTAASNVKLSWNRAQSVKNYMVQTFNYDAGKLYINGLGEADPVGNNATPEGRKQNRRIEFRVVSQSALPASARQAIPEKMKHYNRFQKQPD